MLKRVLQAAVFVLVSSGAAASEVHEYMLDNGMKILVKEDHRAPIAVSQVWYKVGSSYEPPGLTGVSHVLEHMMFKGTEKHGPNQFSQIIAANGGEENAFTGRDYTAYFQTLAADEPGPGITRPADLLGIGRRHGADPRPQRRARAQYMAGVPQV